MDYQTRRKWGANIRRLRREREMTQADLGSLCGVDQCTVSRWEKGRSAPSADRRALMCLVLAKAPGELFPERGARPEPAEASG